jgi:hypothetical protein
MVDIASTSRADFGAECNACRAAAERLAILMFDASHVKRRELDRRDLTVREGRRYRRTHSIVMTRSWFAATLPRSTTTSAIRRLDGARPA